MESKVVLKYWPIRGLAQPARYLLSYLQIPFEDELYTQSEKWFNEDKPNLKSAFPNLPCLVDDGKVVVQLDAILWYLAYRSKNPNLVGSTEEKKVQIIQLQGAIRDLLGDTMTFCRTQEGTPENIKEFFAKSVTPRFERLTKHLSDTGGKFLLGDEVTIADFLCYDILNFIQAINSTALDNFDGLKKFYANFKALPEITAYETSNKFFAKPFVPPSYKFAI